MTVQLPAGATERSFLIAADHPALPGHFPSRPVVPGVVVVGEILAACEDWFGMPLQIGSIPQVKFTGPLLPEQTARAALTCDGTDAVQFRVTRDGAVLASGILRLRVVTP